MAADLTRLEVAEIEARLTDVRARMRPLEDKLVELRADRDVLLTELRRRERLAQRERRAGVKEAMKAGELPTFVKLVEATEAGSFDEYRYHLKTGGEVRLGYPGSSRPAVAFTDGKRVAQARDLAQASELYAAGWVLGSPGRPGVRVHFPGTRQEKLVEPDEIHVRPAGGD